MRRFFASHPATAIQAALWVVVYLLMSWQAGTFPGLPQPIAWRFTTHLFGDLRAIDLVQGQVWRALTANLLHYNLLHLVINLIGFVQLGRMIEEWYGAGRFLLISLVIGVAGNLVSALLKLAVLPRLPGGFDVARLVLGQSIDTPSAGGSVIVCGLVGLIAVVGWRSGTRFGQFVKGQMLAILGFTVLLGVALPWLDRGGQVMLDNLGHAGGAAVGALLGLGHRRWLQRDASRPAWWAAVAAVVLMASGIGLQTWTFLRERPQLAAQWVQLQSTAVREVLREQFRVRVELALALAGLERAYEVVAGGYPRQTDPLERAMSRRAHRAGVPPHWTSWPPPWPHEPAPLRPEPHAQERLLFWLDRLKGLDARGQVPLDAALRDGPAGATYRRLRERAYRALFVRPTPLSLGLFREEWRSLEGRLAEEMRSIEAQARSLDGQGAATPPAGPAS